MAQKLALLGGPKVRTKPFPGGPCIGQEEKEAVLSVLDSGLLSGFLASPGDAFLGGPWVRKLEAAFLKYFDVPFALAVNSATAGLHAVVAALGVEPGDEVIVPPTTMTASASCVLMASAIPVFADIDDRTFCLDPESVERAITPRTRGIIVVHLFGNAAPMDEILAIARKRNLWVVEDCAQAPGALYKGKKVGTLGDAGVFSFNQNKTITTGEGGVVITRDPALARKVQLIRNHGEVVTEALGQEDLVNTLGWNYRMTELEAAVGVGQFERLEKLNQIRIDLAAQLTRGLSPLSGLQLPTVPSGGRHVYFLYPIRLKEDLGVARNRLVEAIKAEGVPVSGGYVRPIYWEPLYQKRVVFGKKGWPFTASDRPILYPKGLCPVAERLYEKELLLTNACRFPATVEDVKDVVRAFEKVFENLDALRELEPATKRGSRG